MQLIIRITKSSIWWLVPLMLWNIAFQAKLPTSYQAEGGFDNVPNWLLFAENTSRIIAFALLAFTISEVKTTVQKVGLSLYVFGSVVYFGCWLIQLYANQSDFATSLIGFTSLAFTPLIWLVGIGLSIDVEEALGKKLRMAFLLMSALFVLLHLIHVVKVY